MKCSPLNRPMSTGRGTPAAAVRAMASIPRGRDRFLAKSLVVPAGM